MSNWKKYFPIALILLLAAYLRFYNLMHDKPYYFNPDERNMAIAITQLRLPGNLKEIPDCIISELTIHDSPARNVNARATGDQPTTLNCNLNPHFFAYGQFPLYLSFTSDQIFKSIVSRFLFQPVTDNQPANNASSQLTTSFDSAIYWLRFWSALTSILTILVIFFISRQLFTFHLSLITTFLAVFTPGLIQSAHFGTTESSLTFFFITSIFLSLKIICKVKRNKSPNPFKLISKYLLLISLTTGLAFGSKLTGLFCLFPIFIGYLIQSIRLMKSKISIYKKYSGLLKFFIIGIIFVLLTVFFCILFSPYNLIDQKEFLGTVFGYEQDVATGRYEAFYTRQFTNTVPISFQMQKVFPFALGWPIYILGGIGILLSMLELLIHIVLSILQKVQISKFKYQIKRIKSYCDIEHLDFICILLFGFWIYLIPNAFLFAKWTRFMTPIFPFFAIFSGYTVSCLYQLFRFHRKIRNDNAKVLFFNWKLDYWIIGLLVFICLLPGLAFFSIYIHPDTRIQASELIYENIPDKSYVLSETANVIDIPLHLTNNQQLTTNNYTVISFDFYHMDENHKLFEELTKHLEMADYIFIPSRRIFANHMTQQVKYPLTTKYYQLLFSGRLGFKKVAEISSFPCLFPKIPLINPDGNIPEDSVYRNQNDLCAISSDEKAEETFTVFDHPVIRIYKKTLPFYTEQYKRMLRN